MSIIYNYPTDTPAGEDLLLGTKVYDKDALQFTTGNPTRNFKVNAIIDKTLASDTLWLAKGVGLTITTGRNYRKFTSRTDGSFPTNCTYEDLQIDFTNFTLDSGYTYKLVLERWKRGKIRGDEANSNKRTGYRAINSSPNSQNAPYSDRPGEIQITSVKGQVFDFRPDLYYSSGAGSKGFPKISGQSAPSYTNVLTSKQFFQFRISKTGGGITVLSQPLAQLKLVASKSSGTQPTITWAAF
jgi:hypothetical protein